MTRDHITRWIADHPYLTTAASITTLLVAAALLWLTTRAARRAIEARRGTVPAAVVVAGIAAVACTAYSGDTSWRFAEHWLDMASTTERAAMFAAGELALFANALMARHNLRTTGTPGTPGVIVWGVTAVQVFAAYAEGGIVGGTVRAVLGPILAAVLWHIAMGIELRHAKPGASSRSLPAVLARELRERLLSRLGLATRGRDAVQITRDRWTRRAVAHAARLAEMDEGKRNGWRGRRLARRLSVAVDRAQAGASPEQRATLLALLAARRHARSLATVALPSPWQTTGATPATPPPASALPMPAAAKALPAPASTATATLPAPASASAETASRPAPANASPANSVPAAGASPVPVPAEPPASPAPASPDATANATQPPAPTATASDSSPDLADVAATYRALRASTGKTRPSARLLGEALGLSRSRGQQLRDALETHPDYRGEFAPALKSA